MGKCRAAAPAAWCTRLPPPFLPAPVLLVFANLHLCLAAPVLLVYAKLSRVPIYKAEKTMNVPFLSCQDVLTNYCAVIMLALEAVGVPLAPEVGGRTPL